MGLLRTYLREKYRQDRLDQRQRERLIFQREKERRKTPNRYCPKCNRQIPFDAYLCPYCGKKFQKEIESKKNDRYVGVKTYEDGNGYLRFKDSNKLVNRYVMEKHTGRKLQSWELVHHIDGDKMNNEPENLRIILGPESRENHTKIHVKQKEETGNWHGIIKCPKCGTEYNEKLNFCSNCGNKL